MGEVRVFVPYGTYDERMAAEELRKRLAAVGDVMFDPPAGAGEVQGTFYMYGDADQLFEKIKSSLEGTQIPTGTSAVIFGEGEPKEVQLG